MSIPKYLCLDVETTGLSDTKDKLHGVSFLINEDEAEYFLVSKIPDQYKEYLANPNIAKIAFNSRFDLRFLIRNGLKVQGRIHDVMLMAQLLNENQSLSLKTLSEKYLGPQALMNKRILDQTLSKAHVRTIAGLCDKDLLLDGHPYLSIIGKYCCEDTHNTFKLFYIFKEMLIKLDTKCRDILGMRETPLTYYQHEIVPTESLLLNMEIRGIRVQPQILEDIHNEALNKRDHYLQLMAQLCLSEIQAIADTLYDKTIETKKSAKGKASVQRNSAKYKTQFNFESSRHIGLLFFEYFDVPRDLIKKTKSGAYDTSEYNLKFVGMQLPQNSTLKKLIVFYALYKKTLKIISTYTGDAKKGMASHIFYKGGLPFIAAKYPQRTVTGRLSSTEPNLQNLARGSKVKKLFIPSSSQAVFLYGDFSQVELRIAAHVSQDERLIEAFTENRDLHKQTASQIFQKEEKEISDLERQIGKTCNFLLIYDGSPNRLMSELNTKNSLNYTIEQCQQFKKNFFEYYSGYASYLLDQKRFMQKFKLVTAENGRLRRLPELVYGDFLNYKKHSFTGSNELFAALKEYPGEMLGEEEAFWRARRRFSHAQKQGLNFPIQGLGATITKKALIAIKQSGFVPITTVHDSIVLEIPVKIVSNDLIQQIQAIILKAYSLSVPLKMDFKLLHSLDEKNIVVDINEPLMRKLS